MFLGIDIGSSSSKVAIIDKNKNLVVNTVVNKGTGTLGIQEALDLAFQKSSLCREEIKFTVVTGYGRISYKEADKQITEITCHAKGVDFLTEGVGTIIDIGGQDAKVIRIGENGKVLNFVMNEKCAAGTGRFLEVMARVLGCRIDELSTMAKKAKEEISISSVCTVFAESEVISQLSNGATIESVAKGAHVAIAKRIAGMCNRVGHTSKIVMTGGVALNESMINAIENELGEKIVAAPHPQEVGAIGAAIFAYEEYLKSKGEE